MAKNIVICSDGTGQLGNDSCPSNVFRLCTLLDLAHPAKQICGYDAGVGTVTDRQVIEKIRTEAPGVTTFGDDRRGLLEHVRHLPGLYKINKGRGLFAGAGLQKNVRQMYEYLVANYAAGSQGSDPDRVHLFGFSRGAFTVRVLAGLLCRCGLLTDMARFSEAYARYDRHYEAIENVDERKRIVEDDQEFKQRYGRPCAVKFLGIWDTVKSYGYLRPVSLPHTRHNCIVKTVRHALSIDEHRKFFEPTTWGGLDPDPLDPESECVPAVANQDVLEVWFAGDHSDVGGGHPDGGNGLARISLKWMINEAVKADQDRFVRLLIDQQKYHQMLGELNPVFGTSEFARHDLLDERGWRWSQLAPRKDLRNCPAPPHTTPWTQQALGRRQIRKSRRNGKVLLHESVTALYSDAEKKERWGSVDPDLKDFALIHTNESVLT